jgi:hypothetical protein
MESLENSFKTLEEKVGSVVTKNSYFPKFKVTAKYYIVPFLTCATFLFLFRPLFVIDEYIEKDKIVRRINYKKLIVATLMLCLLFYLLFVTYYF